MVPFVYKNLCKFAEGEDNYLALLQQFICGQKIGPKISMKISMLAEEKNIFSSSARESGLKNFFKKIVGHKLTIKPDFALNCF